MSTRDMLASATRYASISDCGHFRLLLGRVFADSLIGSFRGLLLFVMLNPSEGDHEVDDATIRRVAGFTIASGFGAFEIVNLFAFRAKKPADLAGKGWQVGAENDRYIADAAARAARVCVAWGALAKGGPAEKRVQQVMPLIRAAGHEPQCLHITRSGHPQHPLYLPGTCRLRPYSLQAIDEAMHGVRA